MTVQSVDRALLLLELLAQAGGRLPISDLAQRSGLPLGTVHRLLTSLAARGYVRQDHDRRYALGTALLPLGDAATRLLSSWAVPFLAQLAEQCGDQVPGGAPTMICGFPLLSRAAESFLMIQLHETFTEPHA